MVRLHAEMHHGDLVFHVLEFELGLQVIVANFVFEPAEQNGRLGVLFLVTNHVEHLWRARKLIVVQYAAAKHMLVSESRWPDRLGQLDLEEAALAFHLPWFSVGFDKVSAAFQ